jgi:hypothetical protein
VPHRLAEILLFATSILLAAIALVMLSPILYDYVETFQPGVFNWLMGTADLYAPPLHINPPWYAAILLPIVSLPLGMAQVLLTAASLSIIIFSITRFGPFPLAALAFALLNRNTLNLLGCGETDTFVLLGVTIGYIAARKRHTALLALAFVLMAIKPPNILLVGLLYLWETRDWKALAFGASVSLVFIPFLGIDYPLRMIGNYVTHPPAAYAQTAIWRYTTDPFPVAVLGILALAGLAHAIRRQGLNEWTLGLALATNLVFTPYALSAHYVLLTFPLVYIARRNLWMSAIIFLISWIPFFSGQTAMYLFYPVSILAVLWGGALSAGLLERRRAYAVPAAE